MSVLATLPCGADTIAFRADIEGASRVATVETIPQNQSQYVSVVSITRQLGGSATLLLTRARLELSGSTAWIQADDNRVNAFRIFTLSRPVVKGENDYLISVDDVSTLFENAFRVGIGRESVDSQPTSAVEFEPSPTTIEPEQQARSAPRAEPVEPAPPTSIDVIVIDPGHGGFEAGVEGAGGLTEKELTLDRAVKRKAVLDGKIPPRIVLTREDDLALNESQRGAIVQNANADILITLHAGSSLSSDVRGSAVFYESGNSRIHGRRLTDRDEARRLADLIVKALRVTPPLPVRGFDMAETRSMAHPGIAGVMVEIGCLTNVQDETALRDDATRTAIVNAIAKGVLQYLGLSTEAVTSEGSV